MKSIPLIAAVLFLAVGGQAQPTFQQRLQSMSSPPGPSPAVAPVKDPVNYRIRVEWATEKGEPQFLEVLTTEGQFNLDTIQKSSVKISSRKRPSVKHAKGH
jgi:hypothetical protein